MEYKAVIFYSSEKQLESICKNIEKLRTDAIIRYICELNLDEFDLNELISEIKKQNYIS